MSSIPESVAECDRGCRGKLDTADDTAEEPVLDLLVIGDGRSLGQKRGQPSGTDLSRS